MNDLPIDLLEPPSVLALIAAMSEIKDPLNENILSVIELIEKFFAFINGQPIFFEIIN